MGQGWVGGARTRKRQGSGNDAVTAVRCLEREGSAGKGEGGAAVKLILIMGQRTENVPARQHAATQ